MPSMAFQRGAIFAASTSTHCRWWLRCLEMGPRDSRPAEPAAEQGRLHSCDAGRLQRAQPAVQFAPAGPDSAFPHDLSARRFHTVADALLVYIQTDIIEWFQGNPPVVDCEPSLVSLFRPTGGFSCTAYTFKQALWPHLSKLGFGPSQFGQQNVAGFV